MTENTFVDFIVTNGVDEIKGYWNTENVEDDEKDAVFFSREGFEQNYVPWNPYDMDEDFERWEVYEKLTSSFQSDELFFDFLYDFKNANRTIEREGYILVINDGAKMELEITSASDYPNIEGYNPFLVRVVPKFNGNNILKEYPAPTCWHEMWTPLFEDTQEQYYLNDGFVKDGAFWMEIPPACFEWSSKYDEDFKKEIIAEYTEECSSKFARVLTSELGVYSISETLEQSLDNDANDWDLFIMDYYVDKDEEEFKSYLVRQGYEF